MTTTRHPEHSYRKEYVGGVLPLDVVGVADWAERYRRLPPDAAESGGQLIDLLRTPYVREIADCLNPDSLIQRVRVMKGAQLGLSTLGENFVGHTIHMNPGKIMYIMPTIDAARRVSNEKLAPMIADCPELCERVASAGSKQKSNTTFDKEFRGGRLLITGANSPVGLRQTSVGRFIIDEEDAYNVTSEGDPIKIVEKRAITFGRKIKILELSTPLVKGISRIESGFENSDQRIFLIPCPHCGHMQELDWGRFNKVPGDVFMTCEYPPCRKKIYESQKPFFLAKGRWHRRRHQVRALESFEYEHEKLEKNFLYWVRVEDLDELLATGKVADMRQTIAGFHISSLYSPLGWYSWEQAVIEWLEAKKDPEKMRVFVNTVLGMPYEEDATSLRAEDLLTRCRSVFTTTDGVHDGVPSRVVLLTGAVDTQDDRLEALICGWAASRCGNGIVCWALDHEVFYGDPGDRGVWDELDAFLSNTYTREDGAQLGVRLTCIDSGGHRTQNVYAHCRGRRDVAAVKGRPGEGHPIARKPSKIKAKAGFPVYLHNVGTFQCKSRIFSILSETYDGPSAIHFPADKDWCNIDFFRQLTAERLMVKYRHGRPYREWTQTEPRNEALDLMVYNLAALHYVSCDPRRFLQKHTPATSPEAQSASASQVTAPPPSPSEQEKPKRRKKKRSCRAKKSKLL